MLEPQILMLKLKILKIKGYEKVVAAEDASSGLRAVIAVHSTALGPSLGGVRMFPYLSSAAALKDAVLLSKAMTYKAAISNLKLGGGKAVVMGHPSRDKTRELFLSLGEFIHRLKGVYIAAEDSGICSDDLDIVSEKTPYVTGTKRLKFGSGDPSPATALGIFTGMRACLKEISGSGSLSGVTVAVQGVGQVGFGLAKLLKKAKARLIISDVSEARLYQAADFLDAKITAPAKIHAVKADIFAPCALGGVLNSATIPQIRARMVAGGANNQFVDEAKHASQLFKRGVLHAPDYVINAGGLIQLYVKEILKKRDITPWIEGIDKTLAKIFRLSREEKRPPLFIARELAAEKISRPVSG